MSKVDLSLTRRHASALLGGSAAAVCAGQAGASRMPQFRGESLFADVSAYDSQGEHRTATAGDDACSLWLQQRLARTGFSVTLEPLTTSLFAPCIGRLEAEGRVTETFPAWPVTSTSRSGVTAPLVGADAGAPTGKIALVEFSDGADGGTWAAPGLAGPVRAALQGRPAAVVAVTRGLTGGIIELNTTAGQAAWPVPVVLVGGADSAILKAAAGAGAGATLMSTGDLSLNAKAHNVVARRRGFGKTIVVSTPKSGWFRCAGERGSGMAIFLALASWLARMTTRDLLFVATSGHELGEIGATLFIREQAPPPDRVAAWLHLGADVAVQGVESRHGGLVGTGRAPAGRRLFVSPGFEGRARRAFFGLSGYENPVTLGETRVPGELERLRAAGYRTLFGMHGEGPLFHTRADRSVLATTPALLAAVGSGTRIFFDAVLARLG